MRGWWILKVEGGFELSDSDREYISSLVKRGFTEGILFHEEELPKKAEKNWSVVKKGTKTASISQIKSMARIVVMAEGFAVCRDYLDESTRLEGIKMSKRDDEDGRLYRIVRDYISPRFFAETHGHVPWSLARIYSDQDTPPRPKLPKEHKKEKKGFTCSNSMHSNRVFYYIKPRGKYDDFSQWLIDAYYALGFAEVFFFDTEEAYSSFIKENAPYCYADYETFRQSERRREEYHDVG